MSLANFAQPTQWQRKPIQPMARPQIQQMPVQPRPQARQPMQRQPAPPQPRMQPVQPQMQNIQPQTAPPQFNPDEVRRYAAVIQELNQLPPDAQLRVIDRIRQMRGGR